jgi:hypothetical protein
VNERIADRDDPRRAQHGAIDRVLAEVAGLAVEALQALLDRRIGETCRVAGRRARRRPAARRSPGFARTKHMIPNAVNAGASSRHRSVVQYTDSWPTSRNHSTSV